MPGAGIELPSGKLRSAKDVEDLQRAWEVAVTGDLVLIAGNRVAPAVDVPQLIAVAREESGPVEIKPDLAERAIYAWVQGAAVPLGVRAGAPCPQCLTILVELARSGEPQGMAASPSSSAPTCVVRILAWPGRWCPARRTRPWPRTNW